MGTYASSLPTASAATARVSKLSGAAHAWNAATAACVAGSTRPAAWLLIASNALCRIYPPTAQSLTYHWNGEEHPEEYEGDRGRVHWEILGREEKGRLGIALLFFSVKDLCLCTRPCM
jgi:hypothetical protein